MVTLTMNPTVLFLQWLQSSHHTHSTSVQVSTADTVAIEAIATLYSERSEPHYAGFFYLSGIGVDLHSEVGWGKKLDWDLSPPTHESRLVHATYIWGPHTGLGSLG
ncbi:hypothetical protein P152DRAFT_139591 [Eremomyces bilateralis CBS 781.70]|uniref:Uncharacterized protein n=1 Tax=Eremomyces bilateralis CBS 781.70 TaxID=1392243 RepID=A0A6G1FWD6_9PEZI|nr:uncharacterized protein P152DRAFT_139591 [Eremomyces bilateralis CBS 781.70]KAF1810093.1 hypothetical protein P152DRAFT_139591 [Eremomyces bilateralis CBS 781.70]